MKTIVFLEQQAWLGGGQRVLEAILSSLQRDGYKPVVAFPGEGPFRTVLEDRKVDVLTLPIGSYRSGTKSLFESIRFALRSVLCGVRLARVVRNRQASLIYINGPRCLPAGVLAGWLTGRPCLFHLHLILTRRLEILLVARLARHVAKVLACSSAAAQSLLNADPRLSAKTEVLYGPAPDPAGVLAESGHPPRRDPSPAAAQLTVGVVGRITETKGQHLLLNAVGRLPLAIRDRIRMIVVGAPAPDCPPDLHYAEHLNALAKTHGLQNQIVWAGYRTDPGSFYASMDVLVHTAPAEPLGLVVLEALQRGIPVIAARGGGIPEIIKEGSNGLLVPPGDEAEFGQALALLLTDHGVWDRLKAGAGSRLDHQFSLENFSSRMSAIVAQLCERNVSAAPGLSGREPAA